MGKKHQKHLPENATPIENAELACRETGLPGNAYRARARDAPRTCRAPTRSRSMDSRSLPTTAYMPRRTHSVRSSSCRSTLYGGPARRRPSRRSCGIDRLRQGVPRRRRVPARAHVQADRGPLPRAWRRNCFRATTHSWASACASRSLGRPSVLPLRTVAVEIERTR